MVKVVCGCWCWWMTRHTQPPVTKTHRKQNVQQDLLGQCVPAVFHYGPWIANRFSFPRPATAAALLTNEFLLPSRFDDVQQLLLRWTKTLNAFSLLCLWLDAAVTWCRCDQIWPTPSSASLTWDVIKQYLARTPSYTISQLCPHLEMHFYQ